MLIRDVRFACAVLAILLAVVVLAAAASAQSPSGPVPSPVPGPSPEAAPLQPPSTIVRRGDAVVTGFAGTLPPGPDLPDDVHPLDRTMIDLEGVTVRVFDLTQLGGGPEGQLSDAPVRHILKARDVGHVFGVAFDGDGTPAGPAPNIYLAASSAHGLQLMAPGPTGRLERVMTGRPGAEWMPGLFGPGGGPGTIWKVDGRTGRATRLADIRNGELENSGAGLGAIAFDLRSSHLYVSDLETGLVWRLALDGRLIDTFDHGTEGRAAAGLAIQAYDPASRTDRSEATFNTEVPESWGLAAPERRVSGLAIENGRLYYAVADGPAVWSVGLGPDGAFARDARLEIDVKGTSAPSRVASLLFDGPGILYVAQRGTQLGSYDYLSFMRPQEAATLRYRWNEADRRWSAAPEEYAVGMPPEHHGVVGGLALNYGYDRFGRIDYDRCRQTLWVTGEHLRAGSDIVRVSRGGPPHVGGLQGIYKSRVKPANEPPFEAWFVDYDASFADEEAYGHIGNVAIYAPCSASVTYAAERVEIPVWTRGPNLVVEKVCEPAPLGGRVRCTITVRNTGDATAQGVIDILDETRILAGPGKGAIVRVATALADGAEWACAATPAGAYACRLPATLLAPGTKRDLVVWIDTRDLVIGGNVGFRNCVTIDHPDGKGRVCAEGGTGMVVTKTGPAVCEPGGECTFVLTLTNASAQPFKGPLLVSDHLLGGGAAIEVPISKIEPPLACAAAPGKLPFACLAEVTLAAGESLSHAITVKMPAAGPSHLQNCFAATDAWLADKPDLLLGLLAPAKLKGFGAGAHPACLWLKLGDPAKIANPAKKLPAPLLGGALLPTYGFLSPSAEICANGRPPLPGGRCPCPLSAPWDPETRTCRVRPVCWDQSRLTPDGDCCPRGSVWWASAGACRVPPVIGCTDPWRRTPSGDCCPGGTRWRDGACRPPVIAEPCLPGFVRLRSGVCIPLPVVPPVVELPRCPDGRARLPNGRCPGIVCPLNAPFNPATGRCERVSGEGCQPGFVRASHGGRCIPERGICPGNLVRDASGRCVPLPPRGGAGVPPPRGDVPPIACPGRLVRDASGKCVPPGLVGGTRPGGSAGEGACLPGQRRVGSRCVGQVVVPDRPRTDRAKAERPDREPRRPAPRSEPPPRQPQRSTPERRPQSRATQARKEAPRAAPRKPERRPAGGPQRQGGPGQRGPR